jgi:hypothetical protein
MGMKEGKAMNLNVNPTPEQLRELIARCDDTAGNHVLWVKRNGEVEIARLPKGDSPNGFQHSQPEMQLYLGPFLAGNEYVGPAAASDDEWVAELFDNLLREWGKVKGKSDVAHVQLY